MKSKFRSILSFMLAMIMMVSLPMAAFADGTVDNGDGTSTTTTTVSSGPIDNGNGTVTVEVTVYENTSTNDPSAPTQVQENVATTTTTVTDSEKNVLSTKEVEEGSRVSSTFIKNDEGTDPGQPPVTVPLTPGQTNTAYAGDTIVSGDVQQGSNDGHYSYTTTIESERSVEASAEESDIVVDTSGQGDFDPIQTDRDMVNVEENQLNTVSGTSYHQAISSISQKPQEGGYDFYYYGYGQMSDFYVGLENEQNPKQVHSGALQFELMQDPEMENGKFTNDAEKDRFTAYCCDVTTGAKKGYWYKLDNLEDAGYYGEEAAEHVRAIATSGYWGTNPGEDAENPAVGSLEKLKQEMKANGNTGLTDEEIDAITPGQALAATQAAIWTYANSETEGAHVDNENGRLIITGYGGVSPSEDDYKKADAVFSYLRNLTPSSKENSTTIIDADSFIVEDSLSITVGDMLAEAAANNDGNNDNNVYDVAINFALVVTPSNENDDLVVQVVALDAENKEYVVAQGRIAGDSSADENFNEVVYNAETGEYSLKNLQLAENSNFSFDLKLSGTQHLQEGVYIFSSEIRDNLPSQTFVGIAEGDKEVSVSQSFTINFNVDENNSSVTIEEWRIDPENNYVPPVSYEPVPIMDEVEEEEVIEEEPVPLAQAPSTGSAAAIFAVAAAASGMGLAGLVISSKRKDEE